MTEPAAPPQRGRPRTAGAYTCDRCGRSTGKIRVRWPDGKICGICFHQATRTFGSCAQCGQQRLLPGRDGQCLLCRQCAGITTDLDCHRCGAEGEHHRRGLCTRCTLRDDLTSMLLPAGLEPIPELVHLVDVLVNVERPESMHTWMRRPRVQQLLRGLGDRSITLEHAGIDAAPAGQAREHTRQLLVQHGLLPAATLTSPTSKPGSSHVWTRSRSPRSSPSRTVRHLAPPATCPRQSEPWARCPRPGRRVQATDHRGWPILVLARFPE